MTPLTFYYYHRNGRYGFLGVGGFILKKVLLCFTAILLLATPVFAESTIFSETIPMQGHIELQESFSLEVRERILFELTQEMAGTTHEVATYAFFSNSPDVAYQLRLSPGYGLGLSEGIFEFRSTLGSNAENPPIPFRLSVMNRTNQVRITDDTFRGIQKAIGTRVGSRSEEQGIIYITFPTIEEGFNIQGFSFGSYEASVAVEVAAD